MLCWRHEDEEPAARLAQGTAATRLGVARAGLESTGQRRCTRGNRWSGQPVAQAGTRAGGRGVAAPSRARRQPRLTPEQRAQLPALLERGPEAHGFRGPVGTCQRAAEVIRRPFGVTYHPAHVSRRLHAVGHRVQRPVQRATQRDAAAIQAWWRARWPAWEKKRPTKAEPASG